ncbi:hypothetical protein [uncultured Formosa sp.]|uniref:hypothetical protein n=1 Tax=uncultured Formosa sp. TaxID=255435 RepID=UPI00263131E9|nr:hypothetical protein [uncultured Formosa sp.]
MGIKSPKTVPRFMSIKQHVLFVVPDGVGIKNYLYSDVLKHLIQAGAMVSIWSPLPESVFDEVKQLHNIEIGYKQLVLKKEPVLTRFYREATTYARLLRNTALQNNATILSNWNIPKQNLKLKLLYQSAMQFGRYLAKDYKRIVNYETKSRQGWSKTIVDAYVGDLKTVEATSLFITHQRVASLMPICIAAKTLGINVNTVIFSWDNLPKARLCVWADQYLVWSEWMQQEMKQYYPEIEDSKIKLVGTPQFDFYLDENKVIDREQFAKTYGLDPQKKWICFSGDDVRTSPYDVNFLEDVGAALSDYKDTIQVIFRRCPADFSTRYDSVLNRFKSFMIPIDPIWHVAEDGNWTGNVSKYEDISMQVSLAYHCETVINLGSTMAFDFSMFNTPCLYLNYNPIENGEWLVETIYKYQHFRSMKGLDAVGWIHTKDAIASVVLKTIHDPNTIAVDRQDWMKVVVRHPIQENSTLIAKTIL